MKKKDKEIQIKKNKQIVYPYCKACERPSKPVRMINNELYYHLWIGCSIASLGFLLPVFLIYHFHFKKKEFCEVCSNQIKYYDSPDKFPGSKQQIERIVSEIQKDKIEDTFCNYCHEKIDKQAVVCPSCGSSGPLVEKE